MWYPQHPLFQKPALNLLGPALFMRTIVQYLFVGTYGFTIPAIPYLRVIVIGKAFTANITLYGSTSQGFNRFGNWQFADVSPLVLFGIEPGIEQTDKDPLGPFKIIRIGGIDFAVPVIAQSQRLNLPAEGVTILLSGYRGMCPGLNGILFCRQSEGIPSHRMKNVEAIGPLEPAYNVGCRISFGMTYVEAGPGRVGEHIQTIEFWF